MERFTNSIRASVEARNWFAALFMALALPDICASLELEQPEAKDAGKRYKDWFQRYLQPKYAPPDGFPMPQLPTGEQFKKLPPNIQESMNAFAADSTKLQFTAEDCWRLRCKCLHQGLPERMGKEKIHFTAPDPEHKQYIHKNVTNGVLQLSIDIFCTDICDAATQWWGSEGANAPIRSRAEELIKIYDILSNEIPASAYGK